MKISRKGGILILGTKSVAIEAIKFVDHDDKFVYVVLEPGMLSGKRDATGITIASELVTDPQEFATAEALHEYIDDLRAQSGIANGLKVIEPSDTVDHVHGYLYIKKGGTGGTIKFTTVDGDTDSETLEPGEATLYRVKRVWVSGTTEGALSSIRILA